MHVCGIYSDAVTTYDLTHPAAPLRIAELDGLTQRTPAKIRFDVNKAALLIVDMQNYFVAPPSAPGRSASTLESRKSS